MARLFLHLGLFLPCRSGTRPQLTAFFVCVSPLFNPSPSIYAQLNFLLISPLARTLSAREHSAQPHCRVIFILNRTSSGQYSSASVFVLSLCESLLSELHTLWRLSNSAILK